MLQCDPHHAPYALVVDDNENILLHLVEILDGAGFSVFAAADSDRALEWLNKYYGDVALLVTNVEIPGRFNGFELARMSALGWPNMGIVVSSGRFAPQRGDMPEGAIFVPKPFSESELIRAGRAVLKAKKRTFPVPNLTLVGSTTSGH